MTAFRTCEEEFLGEKCCCVWGCLVGCGERWVSCVIIMIWVLDWWEDGVGRVKE